MKRAVNDWLGTGPGPWGKARGGGLAWGARGLWAHLGPIGSEGELAEIRERFLRGAELALADRDVVCQVDEQLAVALALVLRHDEDAGDVVPLCRHLLLGEVTGEGRVPDTGWVSGRAGGYVEVASQRGGMRAAPGGQGRGQRQATIARTRARPPRT